MQPLTVVGSLDSLGAIADYVIAAASAVGLDKKSSYRLRLAVDEIATNIILYGYQEAGRQGHLDLHTRIDDNTLSISIEDTGIPYDPYQSKRVSEEELQRPLEERRVGGLGVYLAMDGVDQFIYERVGDRNRNTFVVHCSTPSGNHQNSESKALSDS